MTWKDSNIVLSSETPESTRSSFVRILDGEAREEDGQNVEFLERYGLLGEESSIMFRKILDSIDPQHPFELIWVGPDYDYPVFDGDPDPLMKKIILCLEYRGKASVYLTEYQKNIIRRFISLLDRQDIDSAFKAVYLAGENAGVDHSEKYEVLLEEGIITEDLLLSDYIELNRPVTRIVSQIVGFCEDEDQEMVDDSNLTVLKAHTLKGGFVYRGDTQKLPKGFLQEYHDQGSPVFTVSAAGGFLSMTTWFIEIPLKPSELFTACDFACRTGLEYYFIPLARCIDMVCKFGSDRICDRLRSLSLIESDISDAELSELSASLRGVYLDRFKSGPKQTDLGDF